MLSRVWLFATTWTAVCQFPLTVRFSRQEYWSELPFPSSGINNLTVTQVLLCCREQHHSRLYFVLRFYFYCMDFWGVWSTGNRSSPSWRNGVLFWISLLSLLFSICMPTTSVSTTVAADHLPSITSWLCLQIVAASFYPPGTFWWVSCPSSLWEILIGLNSHWLTWSIHRAEFLYKLSHVLLVFLLSGL